MGERRFDGREADQRPQRDGHGEAVLPRGFQAPAVFDPRGRVLRVGACGGRKQPYFFRLRDEQPFGFAGLWDRWQGDDGAVIESCAIITTEANDVLRPVHDRMPAIIHPEDYELWLDDDERKTELRRDLLQPFPTEEMLGHPVSTLVNSARSQGADLVAQVPVNSL